MIGDHWSSKISEFQDETTHQITTFDLLTKNKTLLVPRGQIVTIGEVKGYGYISQLWMTFPGWFWQHWNQSAPINQSILKTLILRIYWDGQEVPAVKSPVGDFFGNGLCEISNFTSKYFGMSSGGFYCKFPMPFREGFRIELENLDEEIDTEVFANVLYQVPREINVLQNSGYFHTQFHTGNNPGSEPLLIAQVAGNGHYIGCVVSIQGKDRGYLCYLEAPEYVFVDDNWEIPHIVGTGMEDYFLGGWYFRDGPFTGELHGVTSKDALNSSVAMYRIHEADAIRFSSRLRFEFINPWVPEDLWPFSFSSVAFVYLNTPEGQQGQLPPRNRLLCWYRIKDIDHINIP